MTGSCLKSKSSEWWNAGQDLSRLESPLSGKTTVFALAHNRNSCRGIQKRSYHVGDNHKSRPEELDFPNTMTDIDYHTWMLSGSAVMRDGQVRATNCFGKTIIDQGM